MTLGMTDDTEMLRGTIHTDAADPEDRKAWTVKGMPEWVLAVARDAAKARRMSMGEWLTEIIPIVARPNGEATGLPAVPQVPAVIPRLASPGLTEVTAAADLAARLATIEGLPPGIRREAHGLLRDRLREARRR